MVKMIAKGHKFYMGLYSEIFRNLLVRIHGCHFLSFLGVLYFKLIPKYCNVWYEGNLHISQWSDTGPSWPSCPLWNNGINSGVNVNEPGAHIYQENDGIVFLYLQMNKFSQFGNLSLIIFLNGLIMTLFFPTLSLSLSQKWYSFSFEQIVKMLS